MYRHIKPHISDHQFSEGFYLADTSVGRAMVEKWCEGNLSSNTIYWFCYYYHPRDDKPEPYLVIDTDDEGEIILAKLKWG
jgi:hypothetical protein